MTQGFPDPSALAAVSYAVLRYGGAPPGKVRQRLGLAEVAAARLEELFQGRRCGGPDPMRPRFARHDRHVDAVLAEGGYPVLPERCR